MMKRSTLKFALVALFATMAVSIQNAYGQAVSINTSGANPDASSILDVSSANKGMLIPRVALTGTTDNTTISSPTSSLLVYNTATVSDVIPGFYYRDGAKWIRISGDNAQEVNNSQNTTTAPSGLIQCSDFRTWFVNPNSAIPDNGTLHQSMTGVGQTGKICDLNVLITITHTFDADLDITLESPSGTVVELTSDNGGSQDHYTSTVFDDAAATSITAGTAPFTGTYRPEGSLASFNGETAAGDWILQITDDSSVDNGTLVRCELRFTTTQEAPWEYVGEAQITYKSGSTPVVTAYYSANPTNDIGNKIRISRNTDSGSGTVGTVLAYSAGSPKQGTSGALYGEALEYWLNLNVFYHDNASLTDGTTYYYKLWKAGEISSGQQNYSIVPMLLNN